MKKQTLIRRIENSAKIFRARAIKSHADLKRHDLAQHDEQKSMWIAWNRLGWSYRKIGSVYNRDQRTVKRAVESYRANKQAAVASLDAEAIRSKQLRQMEHIGALQKLARSTVDELPELPGSDDESGFEDCYFTLAKLFLRLTGDVHWPDLAAHLGEKAQEIKNMSSIFRDASLEVNMDQISAPANYREKVVEGWKLIINSGLVVVADLGDTRKWEWEGLNQRCHNCPDQ